MLEGRLCRQYVVHYYEDNILKQTVQILNIVGDIIQFNAHVIFDEIHIEVLDDTNGAGIELGGISLILNF